MVLFGVFAFVGGGRGAISLATPHPCPGFSGVCPMVPTLAGGAPKEGTLAMCGKPGPPPHPQHGVLGRLLELPPRPAPPRTRRQSETSAPPLAASPAASLAALAAATSEFTPCRGSGVATSHVSRGPGAPGRATPHGAGQRQPSRAPVAEEARGLPPGPSPERQRCKPRSPPRGVLEPQRPKVNFVCVISPSAPLPPLRPAPRGSIFSSLASICRRCLALHDVMPTAPRFPRELGALRLAGLGCGGPAPGPRPLPNSSRWRG